MLNVLFICLGNICRSPMAEGIFKKMLAEQGLQDRIVCDSAGTSNWHQGELAHESMRETARKHGIELTHKSRSLKLSDFDSFDYLVVMDNSNLNDVKKLASTYKSQKPYELVKMRDFDKENSRGNVPDPYGLRMEYFQECYDILNDSCQGFLGHLVKKHSLTPTHSLT